MENLSKQIQQERKTKDFLNKNIQYCKHEKSYIYSGNILWIACI